MRRTSSDGTDPSLLLSRDFRYSADRAVEVVEGATCATFVTGVSTMLALGIVLNIIGLGFFCWVLLTVAIYALPFFVGMTAGLYAHGAGAGRLARSFSAYLWLFSHLSSARRSSRSCARRSCGSRSR